MKTIILTLLFPLIAQAELRSICFGTIENDTLMEVFAKEYQFCDPKNCDTFFQEEAAKHCPKFEQSSVTIEDAYFLCSDATFEMVPNPDNPKELVKMRTSNIILKVDLIKDFKIKCK